MKEFSSLQRMQSNSLIQSPMNWQYKIILIPVPRLLEQKSWNSSFTFKN